MSSEADGARREREAKLAGLYDEMYDRIARYAYVRIGDKAEAQDIASEVFLRALQSINTYEERGLPMQAWLFRIAHNLVVDHLRSAGPSQTVPLETVEVADDDDPQRTAELNIEMERVTVAMRRLTDEQREVIGLRFFGGLSSKEAGSLLHKSDGAVREMQRAALERLRDLLGEGGRGN